MVTSKRAVCSRTCIDEYTYTVHAYCIYNFDYCMYIYMIYGIFAWNPKYGRQRFSASGQFLATLKRSSHRFWGNFNMNADPPDELTFNSFDSCYSRFMSIISVLWIIAIPPDVVTRVKCDVEILNICSYVLATCRYMTKVFFGHAVMHISSNI